LPSWQSRLWDARAEATTAGLTIPRQISDDELTGMALALTDFGADYADFVANGDNGPRTLDAIAEDDFDPEDERADLERAGWASRYQEFYISPQDAEEPSAFFVGSSIDLFETAEGAADYLDDSRTELTTQIGKSNNGFTFLDYREFDANVADEPPARLRTSKPNRPQTYHSDDHSYVSSVVW
jgi:hypothetical protein